MWRYHLLLTLFSIPAILFTAWQAWQQRDMRFLRERLSFIRSHHKGSIWLHAASVGEVNAVMPLIHALRERYPDKHITLTTSTPTGGEVAQKQLPAGATHCYLPIDFNWMSRRFIARLQPCCALIMETELWPHLYRHTINSGAPLLIINGRLSEKTIDAPAWLRALCPHVLANVTAILARSDSDRERYISLGATASKVKTIGNIKLITPTHSSVEPISLGRPFVLAASTHDDEELRIARLWLSIEQRNKRLLVIVPRHPKRSAAIQQQLATLNCNVMVRSNNDAINETSDIYLADTLGELPSFIATADFVLMGGSLVPVGGHNILEVAQLGKGVLFGQHMETFSDEAKLFIDANAGIQVNSDEMLQESITTLLANPEQARQLGENGRKLIAECGHILPDYLDEIEHHCKINVTTPPLKKGEG
ncbi:3-deoxy-D-manno-octulosonic acid transferase [hydrothermal vent metagenome]|uniref:3-deoxy-D-manno-octulosonic acid transferase n=1 Tax=hydrothermal vent metagenome TaxID=652676 RepID=A0A3B0ZCG2_9ZZZZ